MAKKDEKKQQIVAYKPLDLTNLSVKDLEENVSIDVGDKVLIHWQGDGKLDIATITHIDYDTEEIHTDIGSWNELQFLREMNGKQIQKIQLIVGDEDDDKDKAEAGSGITKTKSDKNSEC
tara:strand:+ start:27256 stop:27615 length:360 start_codon:yes stop_codon:yes gene_type:complete